MRLLPLIACEELDDFLADVRSNSVAEIAALTQDDTIEIAVSKAVRPDDLSTSLDAFVIKPWSFSEIRFSLGYLDKAPSSGTFKLKIGDSLTTGPITWPDDPSVAANVTTFRNAVVAAVNAVAGTGAVRLSTRPSAPANLIYLTWTSPTDERPITIVESALVPSIDTDRAVTNTNALPAYEQLITLSRLPLVATNTFAFPGNAAPGIVREKAGATGVNEVQIISLNAKALGAFYLTYSGASTAPLNIASVTAAQIAAALNALVADGATNPSFAVTARAGSPGTTRFAVSFIGPLAAAGQSLLGTSAAGQETPATVAYGSVKLSRERFAPALNGAATCTVTMELVIVDGGGESTITRDITINDDMTGPGTEAAIAAGGGILIVPTTVYVDESEADPFLTGSVGIVHNVAIGEVAASAIDITHSWSSDLTGVKVHNLVSTGPDVWRECKDTEYGNTSSGTHTIVSFPFAFVNDVSSPFHYAKWKISLTDPDASVSLLNDFKLAWDNCLASLPSGQTLTAKLAAIDTALGVFGGTLRVAAGNITGTLTAAQIDAAGLATSLVAQPTFSIALQSLYQTNSALVTTLLTQLAASSTFATTLAAAVTNNTSITDAISTALSTNSTFANNLQSLVLDVIQGTGNQPAGATTYFIDPVTISMPAPQQMFAPAITSTVPATEQSTIVAGGTTTVVSKATEATVSTPSFTPVYAALSPQLTGLTDGGTKTGKLPATDAGSHYYTVTGSAKSSNARGLRGQAFKDGDVIAFAAGHWSRMVSIGGVHYPADFEQPLVKTLIVDATELYAGSRFSLVFPTFFQLLGNVTGRVNVIAEIGTEASTDAEPASWTQLFSEAVHLSATARLRTFGITVTHATGGALTGTYSLQGQPTSFTPASASFALRVRLSKLTLGASSDPRGDLSVRIAKGAALASIVAL